MAVIWRDLTLRRARNFSSRRSLARICQELLRQELVEPFSRGIQLNFWERDSSMPYSMRVYMHPDYLHRLHQRQQKITRVTDSLA